VERTLTCALSKALITERMRIALLDIRLRLVAAIADELRIRDMRQLTAMDDCRLKDIGMRRREIELCLRYGRDE
jgi:uncharacterized protein YjiS (DUF1127 family)